jgi:hypothetical protein
MSYETNYLKIIWIIFFYFTGCFPNKMLWKQTFYLSVTRKEKPGFQKLNSDATILSPAYDLTLKITNIEN